MARFVSAIGLAAFASPALPQTPVTRIITEVSTDGVNWSSHVAAIPGQLVEVQVRVQYTGVEPVMGLGGFTFQPTLSGWNAPVDRVLPLDSESPFPNSNGRYGRVSPFNRLGGQSTPPFGLIAHVDPGGVLRFAQSPLTDPLVNMAWGVNVVQLTPALIGTNFNPSPNVVTFRYGVTLSGDAGPRTLVASTPRAYFQNNRVTWYRTPTGTNSLLDSLTDESLVGATIEVIPAPSVVALFAGAAFGLAARRRRIDV
jgi:hypothetical protein